MDKYDQLCAELFASYSQVRFAGVANTKGELIAGGQKDGVDYILSDDDVKMSIHYSLQKRDLFTSLAYKIGNEKSAVSEFENVTMISIPISSKELLLISIEPKTDYVKIIEYVDSMLDSLNISE